MALWQWLQDEAIFSFLSFSPLALLEIYNCSLILTKMRRWDECIQDQYVYFIISIIWNEQHFQFYHELEIGKSLSSQYKQ